MALDPRALLNPRNVMRHFAIKPLAPLQKGTGFPNVQYTDPPGDPGLFGPGSVTWRVHSDLAVSVGGITALLLQTLHPLAMAGVEEHSNYRDEPLDRLARTASFVNGTIFGSTEVAEYLIRLVRGIHEHVVGVAPDGRPYSANDPELLRWVHVAEVYSFLRAHQRFNPNPIRGADADRYYDEMAVVAEKLGSAPIPRTRAAVSAYFQDIRPELRNTRSVARAVRFITTPDSGHLSTDAMLRLVIQGAVGLLPDWSREMLGLRQNRVVEMTTFRPALFALIQSGRFSLGAPPAAKQAMARANAKPTARANLAS